MQNNKKSSAEHVNELKPQEELPINSSPKKSKKAIVDTVINTQVDELNGVVEVQAGVEESKIPDVTGVSTPQMVTWGMLFVGWCITVILYRRNRNNVSSQRKSDRHDQYVKEFRDLIFDIEVNTIAFWTCQPKDEDQVTLLNFQRELKELTSKAKEIGKVGGVTYQTKPFIKLRRYVTLDNDVKPLKVDSSRIVELRGIVSDLTRSYIRKSDC